MRYIRCVCILLVVVPGFVIAGRVEPVSPPLRTIEQIPVVDGLYRETPEVFDVPKGIYSQNRSLDVSYVPVLISDNRVNVKSGELRNAHLFNQQRIRDDYYENVYRASIVRDMSYYFSSYDYYRNDPRFDYDYWYGYDNYSPVVNYW